MTMDGFMIVLGMTAFIFGILQIILFFKIWGMTNDVKKMSNASDESVSRYLRLANVEKYLKDILKEEDYLKRALYIHEKEQRSENVAVECYRRLGEIECARGNNLDGLKYLEQAKRMYKEQLECVNTNGQVMIGVTSSTQSARKNLEDLDKCIVDIQSKSA